MPKIPRTIDPGRIARLFASVPNRITVLREQFRVVNGKRSTWCWCRCTCGKEKWIVKYALKYSRSCGCLKREMHSLAGKQSRTHGESRSSSTHMPEYRAWEAMIKRCENPSHESYPRYGGRGIIVCHRWRESYEDFLSDVGRKPTPKHSLDRYPDYNGNYEPGNVRWATVIQQGRNRSQNKLYTYNGKTQCVAQWADDYAINQETLGTRLRRGMSIEDALVMPLSPGRRKRSA